MRGGQLTVAVLAGTDRQVTRGFLALLERSLGAGDAVVLVGTGRDPADPRSWRSMVHRRGLVIADRCPPVSDTVLVVDGRTVPVGPWRPALVGALEDPSVAAAAARTNIAGGDELLIGVPYRPDEPEVHRTFVRSRAMSLDGVLTDAQWLSGPSLVVRREVLEQVGGLRALHEAGTMDRLVEYARDRGRLVIAEASYLHHGGGSPPGGVAPTRWEAQATVPAAPSVHGGLPFLSACMIVRDEHANLPRALRSIEGFCDEIVVYDTGSVDDTRDIARAHGATVVEGYWDDDFSRARNAALEHCRGQWVLWIDADEELVCNDVALARRHLAQAASDAEGAVVLVDNVRGTKAATALSHPACRLFRRAHGIWVGRLHEQVVARVGTPRLATPLAEGLRLTHWGYLTTAIAERHKAERNIKSAFSDLAGDSELPWATRLVSLGRSYVLGRRYAEALPLCRAALEAGPAPGVRRLALRTIIDGLIGLDRPQEALGVAAELRAALTVPAGADIQEGRALLLLGRYEEALDVFARVGPCRDDDGYEYSPEGVASYRATALERLGRPGEAADVLLAGLRSSGAMDAPLGMLVECLEKAGRALGELVDAVPEHRAVAFLGQLAGIEAQLADRVLEAWWDRAPSRAVLAAVTAVAHALGVDRQRIWSERLRADGLGYACPLVASVADRTRPVPERAAGAAIAWDAFGDARGRQALVALAAAAGQGDAALGAAIRTRLAEVAPAALPVYDATTLGAPTPDVGATSRRAVGEGAGPVAERRRRVLVVDRLVSSIRTMALARVLRSAGHDVTVLHPQPAAQTEELLAGTGVAVGGWVPGTQSADPVLACIAHHYAQRRFDTVLLARTAADLTDDVRQLVPGAQVVVDADDGSSLGALKQEAGGHEAPVKGADLVLCATSVVAAHVPGGRSVTASAVELFSAPPVVSERLRTGVLVVGDLRCASDAETARWCEHVAPLMQGLIGTTGLAVVGDGLEHAIAQSLAGALVLGPLADPLGWMASARVAIVASRPGAAHWLAVAALCGTPALLVPEEPDAVQELARAVTALADPNMGALWTQVAAGAGVAGGGHPTAAARLEDPLGPLDPPRLLARSWAARPPGRRREVGAGPARVFWPGGGVLSRAVAAELSAGGALVLSESATDAVLEVRTTADMGTPLTGGVQRVVDLEWGFGHLPEEWLGPLRDWADRVWVKSAWGWAQAVMCGVPDDLVEVVPPVVDTRIFHPKGTEAATERTAGAGRLRATKATKLLFVGDCSWNTGVDALLETYLRTFSSGDDVCLIVASDTGDFLPEVRKAAAAHGFAEIEVVDAPLTAGERAELYRSCDVVIAPHRECQLGTVLEAMSCGVATIVPGAGTYQDFCTDATSWLVESREVPLNPYDVGRLSAAGRFWHLEVDRDALASAMREATDPEARRSRGVAGYEAVLASCEPRRVAGIAIRSLNTLIRAGAAEPGDEPQSGGAVRHAASDHGCHVAQPGSVVWHAPFYNHSGYGEEARGFLRGLSDVGWHMVARSTGSESASFVEALRGTETFRALMRAARHERRDPVVVVQHAPGNAMHPVPGARVCVGRTMFETDGLPATWVEALNQLDEVWVPSAFNVETFSHAGVTAPMYVIGGGVDVSLYRPGRAPLSIEGVGKDSVVFLSIFEWTHRKAPDVLLAAWADAFGPGDPVALVLRAFPRGRFTGDVQGAVEALVDTELERLGACRDDIAPIIVLGNALGPADMPRLLGAADVFVGVSRGEGWGRPLHEAMACGLPAVATRWSGNLAFMDDDNSLLVDVDALVDIDERMDLAFYRGQHWAEPSVAHLRAILKKAALDEELRQRLGERARADIVARWQWEHVSALADARLRALVRRAGGSTHSVARSGPGARTEHRAEGREALRVRWVGDFYGDHSLATVNRELCTQLADLGTAHVQPVTTERPPYPVDNASTVSRLLRAGGAADPNGAADVEVRLSWPPDLTSSALPLVVAQPWEYGGLPERYVTGMRDVADEVWVPTTWVRDCFVRSGLDAERVAVVPLGVDTDVFCPDGDRLALESDKPLRFLFVGGALRRKGVDLLLDTYLDCFGPRDDVCLVLKLFGTYGVYQHATLGDRMRKAAADPGSAAVEVIDRRLSKAEMASLYRACDVLVHPYRGEGFGLPIAEAMACGLPTIVTAYGACLDFCDTTTSWMLPAEEVPAEVDGFGPSPIGYWVAEPDAKSLQQTLLEALVDGRLRAEKGAAARHRIEGGFSWRHSARIVAERLAALRARAARAADREA